MIEVKTAQKSFAVSVTYIDRLWKNAVHQGKNAMLVLQFNDYEIEMHIRRRTKGDGT